MKNVVAMSWVLLMGCAASASSARAQEDFEHGKGQEPGNYLGGHRFSPSFLIPNPFANTQVTVGFGAGNTTPTISFLNSERELDIATFSPFLEAQFTVLPKFTLGVQAGGTGLAGTNSDSVLIYGATVIYRLSVGALYQVVTAEKVALSAGINVAKPRVFAISPLAALIDRLEDVFGGGTPDASNTNEVWSVVPNVRYAYAFSPIIGAQGQVGMIFNTANDEQGIDSGASLLFSVGGDLQLKPWLNVPLSVAFAYRGNQFLKKTETAFVNNWEIGIYETAAKSFSVGAEYVLTTNASGSLSNVAVVARHYY